MRAKESKNKEENLQLYQNGSESPQLFGVEKVALKITKEYAIPNMIQVSNNNSILFNKKRNCFHYMLRKFNRVKGKINFLNLARTSFPIYEQEIQKFQNDYSLHKKTNNTPFWYTKDTFFYRVLNKGLRELNHPCELSYLQLPFSDLFLQIKNQFKISELKKEFPEGFTCYRGAKISSDQKTTFMKIGEFVEMLGFLSTSLKKQVAIKFIHNTLFEIYVSPEHLEKFEDEVQNGFILLQKSQANQEKEVLFNCMNYFLINGFKNEKCQIVQQNGQSSIFEYSLVFLKYIPISSLIKKKKISSNLLEKEEQVLTKYLHQQNIAKNIKNQACCLYFSEYFEDAKAPLKLRLIEIQNKLKNQDLGVVVLIELKKKIQENDQIRQFIEEYIQTSIFYGDCCYYLGSEEGKHFLLMSKNLLKHVFAEQSQRYCRILSLLSKYYYNQCKINSGDLNYFTALDIAEKQGYYQLREKMILSKKAKVGNLRSQTEKKYYQEKGEIITNNKKVVKIKYGETSVRYFQFLRYELAILYVLGKAKQMILVGQQMYSLFLNQNLYLIKQYKTLFSWILIVNYRYFNDESSYKKALEQFFMVEDQKKMSNVLVFQSYIRIILESLKKKENTETARIIKKFQSKNIKENIQQFVKQKFSVELKGIVKNYQETFQGIKKEQYHMLLKFCKVFSIQDDQYENLCKNFQRQAVQNIFLQIPLNFSSLIEIKMSLTEKRFKEYEKQKQKIQFSQQEIYQLKNIIEPKLFFIQKNFSIQREQKY